MTSSQTRSCNHTNTLIPLGSIADIVMDGNEVDISRLGSRCDARKLSDPRLKELGTYIPGEAYHPIEQALADRDAGKYDSVYVAACASGKCAGTTGAQVTIYVPDSGVQEVTLRKTDS